MIEIFAIIRPQKLTATKEKLIEIGYPAYTCINTKGRGKKPVKLTLPDGSKIRTTLVSKRVLLIIVPDEAETHVVEAIMEVNSTGTHGDGKIFVTPVEKSYKIRTRALTDEY